MRGFVVGTLLAAAVLGAACAPEPEAPPVVVPGAPGEPARTLPADEASAAVPSNRHNDADVSYVQRMIMHHQQAIRMGELVPARAAREDVKGLAARIAATQGPEITSMTAWLRQRGLEVPGEHSGHHGSHAEHGPMPGMATEEQLAALAAASGPEFDRLFLQLMTAHHEGAITMATEVLGAGADVFVEEMATDVIASQTDEVHRMRAMAG
ncbi:DUF305 domain-containing protein [Amycolatopsis thermalba]|uniref:DUF305 domain-containing protein n=1 Tax=Amycolatopsis thermalba TaxID=944492 RepID=A0ABY4NUJ0_9PSEU|nr:MULTISPECIES: DUF305 domain-containing protein [Amycolatopsis]OXM72923.1 DUF305 domain-containing protein [Amycolatopsis sp. KNN50.9b]UQS23713.1 DUF305 domain-containing protein [Amycolatopsis thermalba]